MGFWNFVASQESEEIELRISGNIEMEEDFWSWLFGGESTTPKGFRRELAKYKGKNLVVWINSPGGDVYAASSIYTSLKEHKGKVTVKIDGYACSAASVIAMAGDEVYMSPTSIMMIHNPWGAFQGEEKDMRHAADVLAEVKETILNAYVLKTKKSRDKISAMMDEETWMGAKTAVKEGFANGILYEDNKKDEKVENSFSFSRLAIQNSASESTKTFVEQYNKRIKDSTKDLELKENEIAEQIAAKIVEKLKNANQGPENTQGSFLLPPKEENTALTDLYKKIIQNNERRLKAYEF